MVASSVGRRLAWSGRSASQVASGGVVTRSSGVSYTATIVSFDHNEPSTCLHSRSSTATSTPSSSWESNYIFWFHGNGTTQEGRDARAQGRNAQGVASRTRRAAHQGEGAHAPQRRAGAGAARAALGAG